MPTTKTVPVSAPIVDWKNGCDFCGHLGCKGCCWKCRDPKCQFNLAGECPDCPKSSAQAVA